jgi:hypothetical protein
MPNENDRPQNDWLKMVLKAVLLTIVVLVGIVVVGFGLLVGICSFGARC